jgi:hypothetical protein
MSLVNCTPWVYITPNVPVTDIYYAVPCEACFISKEYAAAKEGIPATLLKESLANFLAWAKAKWTQSLYPWVQQLFMQSPPHVQQLISSEHRYGNSPLCVSVCAVPRTTAEG